ncbi:MAG TPA: dihydropteroate synthase [Mycobacteriales bacterium]|nr:dihydropteroate synthase [Mycobacteriales bacterium]
MGVLNVTPDSFSDGGEFADTASAVDQGLALTAAGADLIDVGGESTRPGAERVPAAEEVRRVLPVVRALAAAGVVVSIDTLRASTAASALAVGATMVNDVSGGTADPGMAQLVADAGVPWVLAHSRGASRDMQTRAVYVDVVQEVRAELGSRVDAALSAGVAEDQLILDPGLGFAKTAMHNWSLLARLDALRDLGRPVLVGASRKSFLAALVGSERPAEQRDAASAAITALVARDGAWCVRVHDAGPNADAVRVVEAVTGAIR